MKVFKFGGSSVGNKTGLSNLREIIRKEDNGAIVVVSALEGVTDALIDTAAKAAGNDRSYQDGLAEIKRKHRELILETVDDHAEQVLWEVDKLLNELESIFHGLFLIHDLSEKTLALIVSYGERISSRIVAQLLPNSVFHDSRKFIKTGFKQGRCLLDMETTNRLVREEFLNHGSIEGRNHIVPGFIATDVKTGEVTNLGRGGSDYTASILCGALDCEELQIWTDVDGFMTAAPKVVPNAYTIKSLSYKEAMELSNFGAKVIYPPTIYPVCIKNIPILVKNTFAPEQPGTVIRDIIDKDDKPIKGISSISGAALITVTGLSMVGVIGVNRRIFTALADRGISVFMVSQASSENSTSVGVRESDAEEAARILNEEFAKEIETGAMYPMQIEYGLATIAIVGENMKHIPGIAGKLFGTLGRSGISVIACAQGASQTNISFAIKGEYLIKALNVIHDSFFLSEYKELNLFICGVGTVGGKLIEQIRHQHDELMRTHRLKINVVGIASSRHAIFDRNGIDLTDYRSRLDASENTDITKTAAEIMAMNLFNSVFVDCTASSEVAELYQTLLDHNISVVAANKVAASGKYSKYRKLKESALRNGVHFLYETNVGAGLPIIGTINDLRAAGDRILKIEAVLSGTLNFIFNAISKDTPFSRTIRMAKEMGYSEPDPRIDLSGKDVVRKLVILTREAGYVAEVDDVEKNLFVPAELFAGDEETFWNRISELDNEFESQRAGLEREGKRWRFVARMELGKMSVGLETVDARHPFYALEGSNNIILLTTERYREYPMMIQGYGAGADVTAAGVFANIISTSNN